MVSLNVSCRLSLQYHPDKNKNKAAQEKFAEINNGKKKKEKKKALLFLFVFRCVLLSIQIHEVELTNFQPSDG